MAPGGTRIAAAMIDGVIMLMPLGVLLNGSGQALGSYLIALPAIMVGYSLLFHSFLKATPGKMIFGATLSGEGCLVCRELRKSLPFFVAVFIMGVGAILFNEWANGDPTRQTLIVYGTIALGAICILVTPIQLLLTFLGRVPTWDSATGFSVTR